MVVVGSGFRGRSDLTSHRVSPDVGLMDFRLTDGTGADAGTAIREVRPETKLIFLTREDSDALVFGIEAGSQGLIHKSRAAGEVVDAIRTVAGGGSLFTPRTISALITKRKGVSHSSRDSPL